MKEKIGVGIITYKREEYFKQVFETIPFDRIGHCVVVNDGPAYTFIPKNAELIQHAGNTGVGVSKNQALTHLILKGCEYLFLIEDDILIKDPGVFEEYIRVANVTGIHHLNFEKVGLNTLRTSVAYEDGETYIDLFRNPQGAFSYFRKQVIDKLGAYDADYKNAFEHIDVIYRYAKEGIMPPFWYFPDIHNSEKYLEPIKGSIENSSITNKEEYQKNWQAAAQRFISIHGAFTNQIPDVGVNKALSAVQNLQKLYGKRDETNSNTILVQPEKQVTTVPSLSS